MDGVNELKFDNTLSTLEDLSSICNAQNSVFNPPLENDLDVSLSALVSVSRPSKNVDTELQLLPTHPFGDSSQCLTLENSTDLQSLVAIENTSDNCKQQSLWHDLNFNLDDIAAIHSSCIDKITVLKESVIENQDENLVITSATKASNVHILNQDDDLKDEMIGKWDNITQVGIRDIDMDKKLQLSELKENQRTCTLAKPSMFGCLISSKDNSSITVATTTFILAQNSNHNIKVFDFDLPSPDDKVMQKRSTYQEGEY